MYFLNEEIIFSILFKNNKKYSIRFKKKNFPCIINNSNVTKNLLYKFIKLKKKLIKIKYVLNVVKIKKIKTKIFTENKFSNFNTKLDLFVCK